MPTRQFLLFDITSDSDVEQLSKFASRIAVLLDSPSVLARRSLPACLDDLLGAVYALMLAKHHDYVDRMGIPLSDANIKDIGVRAKDMSHARLRTEGKWTAGYYFNDALYRIAAVYHRALKVLTGNEAKKNLYVHDLLPLAESEYLRRTGRSFEHVTDLDEVYREVNGLKHTSKGIIDTRSVSFQQGMDSLNKILDQIEVLQ